MLPCLVKKYFGIECPGCGIQRSFLKLIQGDILGSIQQYPGLIPLLFLIILLGCFLIKPQIRLGKITAIWAQVTGFIIAISYIYHQSITFKLF
jgi:hypothetical protein